MTDTLFDPALTETLARTLLHSIWQIALAAGLLFLVLRLIPRADAARRYAVAVCALILSLVLPAATFVYLARTVPTGGTSSYAPSAAAAFEPPARPEAGVASERNTDAARAGRQTGTAAGTGFPNLIGNAAERLLSDHSSLLVILWLGGVLLFSVRLGGGFRRLRRYRTRGVAPAGEEWRTRLAELRRRLGVRDRVRLVRSDLVDAPMVVGWFEPLIIIPAAVFLQMEPRQIETIVAHELAHVKRLDYPVNLVQNCVETIFFYHPCVWWISAEIRRERECACDDMVVRLSGDARLTYVRALADLEDLRRAARTATPRCEVAANGGNLVKRIERILTTDRNRAGTGALPWPALPVLLLLPALVLSGLWSGARGADDSPTRSEWSYDSGRKMAVGFVSIPPPVTAGDHSGTHELLIRKLRENRVPAIGFVTGARLSDEPAGPTEFVRRWRAAGLEVGVGGYEHLRFAGTDYAEYVANVEKNLRTVAPLVAGDGIRYFSYPFLNTGADAGSQERFRKWLSEKGLTGVPYTFDNSEWLYSHAYEAARRRGDAVRMRRIREEFVEYMERMVVHYERFSRDLFGREIPQTLVLTPSRLVADTADGLFGMLRDRGYEFVPMREALADEAFREPENFTGRRGVSWLERWALTRGAEPRPEPAVHPEIEAAWRDRPAPAPAPSRTSPVPAPTPPAPPAAPSAPPAVPATPAAPAAPRPAPAVRPSAPSAPSAPAAPAKLSKPTKPGKLSKPAKPAKLPKPAPSVRSNPAPVVPPKPPKPPARPRPPREPSETP